MKQLWGMAFILVLAACSPLPPGTTQPAAPVVTNTSAPALPVVSSSTSAATAAGDPLPYRPNLGDTSFCDGAPTSLAVEELAGSSEDQIVTELFGQRLSYFKDTHAPGYCRLENYRINEVYHDSRLPSLPLQPKGDINRVVRFSMQVVQVPNYWISISGPFYEHDWMDASLNLSISKTPHEYRMVFAFP